MILHEQESNALDRRTPVHEQEGRSFEDLKRLLHDALMDLEVGDGDGFLRIRAVFDDRVVYQIRGERKVWSRPYEVTDSGRVSLGSRVHVVRRVLYEPVDDDDGTETEEAATPGRAKLREVVPAGEALAEATLSGNVLQNVTILGKLSKNNRRYTDEAMKQAADLYEGVQVHLDHPAKGELRKRSGVRSVTTIAGRIISARKVGDRIRGDLEILEAEPGASLVKALASQMPSSVGLSHRARGDVRRDDNGVQVVETVLEVHGVDLVAEPATASLAESVCHGADCDRTPGQKPVTDEVLAEAQWQMFT